MAQNNYFGRSSKVNDGLRVYTALNATYEYHFLFHKAL